MYKINVDQQKGFSIIEMAFIVAIIGLIGVGVFNDYGEQDNLAKWKQSKAKLKVVKKALLEFARVNKHMPCPTQGIDASSGTQALNNTTINIPLVNAIPATPAVPGTDTTPTIPAIPATPALPPINNVPINACAVDNGTVPYEILGLSRADVLDAWENPFMYAIDKAATNPNLMWSCPASSACFFNGDSLPVSVRNGRNRNVASNERGKIPALPAFDFSTMPTDTFLKTNPLNGGNTFLRICTDSACGTVVANGLEAVLVAFNSNGRLGGNSAAENENNDGAIDVVYVQADYQEGVFDDVLLGISANEIKQRTNSESIEVIDLTTGSTTKLGHDIGNLGDQQVGTSGTNLGTNAGDLDQTSQTLSFGKGDAGKQVVLNFNTHAVGAWDKAATTYSGVFDDRGSISANGTKLKEFDYDHLADTADGYEQVTFESAITGQYSDLYNADGTSDNQWVTEGNDVTTWQPYWDESHEYLVTLDSNGDIVIDFEVETTATVETIDFTDINVTLFDTPPQIPSLPSVEPIVGIDETQVFKEQ